MLFLGTEKYPSENEFEKFLNEHGGSSNAHTTSEITCYHFDVLPEFLKDALDRFAQFFMCPLFTESSSEKEVNAIDSEHKRNLQNDSRRLGQLEKSTSKPDHDYNKFGTGNIDTLWNIPKSKGINVREELLKFHNSFYSSNIMALAVLGKESIEDLIDIVVPLFSNISNKNIQIPECNNHPFDSSHLKLQCFVVPVKDIKRLNMSFPTPDLSHLYKSDPTYYLEHLCEHQAPGSLLFELKTLGWANALSSRYEGGAKGFAFFSIDIDLTDKGIDHIDEIVSLFFQYLAFLRKEGLQKWIFDECKNLESMKFRFKDKGNAQHYTRCLARRVFDYPMEEVLSGPYLLETYEPQLIIDLMNMLIPDRVRITAVAKKFEDICSDVEKWYGTQYKLQPISESLINAWKNIKENSNFKLPPPNEFIPSNFQLYPRDENNSKFPQLIKNTLLCRLWFKQDDEFLLPKAEMYFEFESPVAYFDALHHNATSLFVELVKDSLQEYTYAAELAGIAYSLRNTGFGINLCINGYSDKQHIILKKIMDRITNFKIDEKRFLILKEKRCRNLKNFCAEPPDIQATHYTSVLLIDHCWSIDECIDSIEEITVECVQQIIQRFLSKIHIEALIHGNVTEKQALAIMDIIESALEKNMGTKHLMPSQLCQARQVQLCDGHHYVYEVVNEVHCSSCVEVYYQCGVQETRSNMLLELLCNLMYEPCYTFLRTQEQLGYNVKSGILRNEGVQGFRILVQSDKLPDFIDEKIETFIQYFEKYFQEMSNEEFQNHIQALSSLCLEKPTRLDSRTYSYWVEIARNQYNFDRANIEVAALQTITKEELYLYFKDLIACDAPHRKKLSVHVLSSTSKSVCSTDDDQKSCVGNQVSDDGLASPPSAFKPPEKIDDVIAFKHSHGLYPLVPPFICIPPPSDAVSKK